MPNSTCLALSASIPLIHVDVLPQLDDGTATAPCDEQEPSFLAACLKVYLLKASLSTSIDNNRKQNELVLMLDSDKGSFLGQGTLSCGASAVTSLDMTIVDAVPVLMLPQNNVVLPALWPCKCRGYIEKDFVTNENASVDTTNTISSRRVHVTESTTLHVVSHHHQRRTNLTSQLAPQSTRLPSALVEEVCTNQNPETIRELLLRMKQLWRYNTLRISNTAHALERFQLQQERRRKFAHMFENKSTTSDFVWKVETPFTEKGTRVAVAENEAMLLVHSPDHGAGKTLLVQALAQRLRPNARIHVISCATLLATYGVAADAALESNLHQLVYAAALQQDPICVVLDNLEAILQPPSLGAGGTLSTGDAAMPVLHAMTAYLRILGRNQSRGIFPFPSKNPLYNVGDGNNTTSQEGGHVFAVSFLCIGILTCPDHGGGGRVTGNNSDTKSILDSLSVTSKYRLPSLTASTRLTALMAALNREGVVLADAGTSSRLPRLAASAVWMRGSAFARIAQNVPKHQCKAEHLRAALAKWGQASGNISSTVSFESSLSSASGTIDLFASVGGNTEAKLVLHEALSLDPKRRALLASFGLSPPTGIMLFGPPGCGKTLLAKSVAKLLQNESSSTVGGAFVSLSSSDIVHAEVGTGEKLLVSAFETARMNAPAVVFIDEFQALFTDRSSVGSSRFSSTLLSLLDDIRCWEAADQKAKGAEPAMEEGKSQRVVVLAATNTPWMVDKAFLRPGRFDHVVHVGLPGLEDRRKIFELLIGKMKTTFGLGERMTNFSQKLAEATKGYSGADISVVCGTAAVNCLVADAELVNEEHFHSALGQVKASSNDELVTRISSWKL